MALRELPAESVHQYHAFLPGDLLVPDFLRGILRRAAVAEFDECRVVEEIIRPVIKTVVLAVGSGRALGSSLETAVLHGVVEGFLWVPVQVVA